MSPSNTSGHVDDRTRFGSSTVGASVMTGDVETTGNRLFRSAIHLGPSQIDE
jgi:hypothetical protein